MHEGPLQIAQVVAGKYAIERELGRGGMGAVYLVRHRGTGKQMALKCLLPEFLDNADLVERFLREAQVAGRVHHRNVVDVFDVGRDGDVLYLVMELLEGKSLSAFLRDVSITLEEALLIIVRAMEGVAAVHAHGIIHRDLKPDNIFVTYGTDGRLDHPKVLDFGISKQDGSGQGSLTQSGMALGTPYYMCIEQLSGQRDLDQRVDVYAMGVILYEAIAGVPPHLADSISALAIKLMTKPPVSLEEFRPDLPPGLSSVIMQAISFDRAQRQPTLLALIDAIRPFVPQASGVRLPEGAGRPLRTPRSGAAALAVRDQRSPVALPNGPGQGTPPHLASAHDVARTPPPTEGARSGLVLAAVVSAGVLLLGLGGFVAWRMQGQVGAHQTSDTTAEAPNEKAQGVPQRDRLVTTVRSSPPSEPVAQQVVDAGSLGAGASLQAQPEHGAGDRGPSTAGPSTAGRVHKPHRLHSGHPVELVVANVRPKAGPPGTAPTPASPSTPPKPAADSSPTSAQGRAGALGKEDFQ